jgi:hypothetical protein
MGQSRPMEITFAYAKHLRFSLKPPESTGVQKTSAIAFERRSRIRRAIWSLTGTASCPFFFEVEISH